MMPLWLAVTLGAGAGTGIVLAAAGAWPARPALAAVLAARAPRPPAAPDPPASRAARAARPAAALLAAAGLPRAAVRRDLALLGRPADQYLAGQAAAAAAGLLLAPAAAAAAALAGIRVPLAIPAWAGLGLAAAGLAAPGLAVRSRAAARRADARHAVAAFADLAVIALAGGAGTSQALADAAAGGDGWAFTRIRGALAAARVAGTPPWDGLAQLADDAGLPDLAELAASARLAGTEGARIRASLAARAAAIRARQAAQAEADAAAATERMALPVALLFAGFLLFLAYPAVTRILAGL
jgi:tight adherence protein C